MALNFKETIAERVNRCEGDFDRVRELDHGLCAMVWFAADFAGIEPRVIGEAVIWPSGDKAVAGGDLP
jgi:hypothetical protein